MKYTAHEKQAIYKQWFTNDNMILKPLDGLNRYNSVVDDYVIKNKKLIFELLELDGPDLIRFAMARDGDCTCRSVLADKEDIIVLRNFLNKTYPPEND